MLKDNKMKYFTRYPFPCYILLRKEKIKSNYNLIKKY